jgi:hypothetical protein
LSLSNTTVDFTKELRLERNWVAKVLNLDIYFVFGLASSTPKVRVQFEHYLIAEFGARQFDTKCVDKMFCKLEHSLTCSAFQKSFHFSVINLDLKVLRFWMRGAQTCFSRKQKSLHFSVITLDLKVLRLLLKGAQTCKLFSTKQKSFHFSVITLDLKVLRFFLLTYILSQISELKDVDIDKSFKFQNWKIKTSLER